MPLLKKDIHPLSSKKVNKLSLKASHLDNSRSEPAVTDTGETGGGKIYVCMN